MGGEGEGMGGIVGYCLEEGEGGVWEDEVGGCVVLVLVFVGEGEEGGRREVRGEMIMRGISNEAYFPMILSLSHFILF